MRTASIAAATFAFGLGMFTMTRDAHALGPIDLELGLKAGGASSPYSNGPNPLGFGIGARAGVGIVGIYAGLQVEHYFGGSESSSAAGQSVSFSNNTTMYGLELGYSITVSLLTIRPQLGLGNASFSRGNNLQGFVNADFGQSSDSNFYLEPGVVGLVKLGIWYVGADANILAFPGLDNSQVAFAFNGQVGVKL